LPSDGAKVCKRTLHLFGQRASRNCKNIMTTCSKSLARQISLLATMKPRMPGDRCLGPSTIQGKLRKDKLQRFLDSNSLPKCRAWDIAVCTNWCSDDAAANIRRRIKHGASQGHLQHQCRTLDNAAAATAAQQSTVTKTGACAA
jgi:hypothetical protein